MVDKVGITLIKVQNYLEKLQPDNPTAFAVMEGALRFSRGGPIGGLASYAIDAAITEFACKTGLDRKTAELALYVGSRSACQTPRHGNQ